MYYISAADLTGATLNQFLVQSALEKAESIIEKDKIIYLSNKDAQRSPQSNPVLL
jgi:uncharacterized protein (DUF1778 family)